MTRDVAVICTRNRPELARRAALQLRDEQGFERILIVDGSDDGPSQRLAQLVAGEPNLEFRRTTPGLAHQRNIGAAWALEDPGTKRVWWFDDDGDVQPGYRQQIVSVFEADTAHRIGGVGGRVLDERSRPTGLIAKTRNLVKRAFLLYGPEGSLLPSGRNAQVLSAGPPREVDWLQGCAAVYRRDVLAEMRWDDRLVGYSWGEDFDFSHRVARHWQLWCVPQAVVINEFDAEGRWDPYREACTRTVLLHAWVREQPDMRLAAFWWSLVGELLYVAALTVTGNRTDGWEEVRGLLAAARIAVTGGSRRDFVLERSSH